MTLDDFISHEYAQTCHFAPEHVVALRLYSTAAFKSIVNPLRDTSRTTPYPFPATIKFIEQGIRMSRALSMSMNLSRGANEEISLWRGMKDMARDVPKEFFSKGGVEYAPMSTTPDLKVAVQYSASQMPMLIRIRTNNWFERGADISWLSAFPAESECLFAPLTYERVREVQEKEVRTPSGQVVTFTVVNVDVEVM